MVVAPKGAGTDYLKLTISTGWMPRSSESASRFSMKRRATLLLLAVVQRRAFQSGRSSHPRASPTCDSCWGSVLSAEVIVQPALLVNCSQVDPPRPSTPVEPDILTTTFFKAVHGKFPQSSGLLHACSGSGIQATPVWPTFSQRGLVISMRGT